MARQIPTERQPAGVAVAYETKSGIMLQGSIEDALLAPQLSRLKGKINLLFTSPPFPLKTPKAYGNKAGDEYVTWLSKVVADMATLLAEDGSIVIEMGNAWNAGEPTMSTLPLEALLSVKRTADLALCQQFVCHNPTRLPGPAEWVTVQRIRVKDNYTHVWWMAKTHRPKANNRGVLTEYSPDMKKLLATQEYNAGRRPSGHHIGESTFLKDNGGAIPGNMMTYGNTKWNAKYVDYCRSLALRRHPARMQPGLVEFFVKLLTDPKDLVFDPFAGSNTTGAVAEELGRRWISVERDPGYVSGSRGRFPALVGDQQQLDL